MAAILSRSGKIQFYNIARQQKMQALDIGLKAAIDVQFSRNGRMLAVLGLDGVEVYETSDGKRVMRRATPFSGEFVYHPVMALSSEGGLLAYSDGAEHQISLFEVPGGRRLGQLALYPDGTWASARGDDLQVSGTQVMNRIAYVDNDGSFRPISQGETTAAPAEEPIWTASSLLRAAGQGDSEAHRLLVEERGRGLSLSLRKEVQAVLQVEGHYAGSIDGILGSGSQAAIARYLDR